MQARAGEHDEHEVLVVAPALNGRLAHYVSDVDRAEAAAEQRVSGAVQRLRDRGLVARGEIGDAHPFTAIDDALAVFAADELIIATHPPGESHWLEKGLFDRARAELDLPVDHVVSEYGLQAR